ncbi:hypothetical protein D3C86_1370240 [compost metagenome]
MRDDDLSAVFVLVVIVFLIDLAVKIPDNLLFSGRKMQRLVGLVIEIAVFLYFGMKMEAVQVIFVDPDDKAFFFEFYIVDFYNLSRLYEHHRAVVMVVFRPAIEHITRLDLLKSDHVKIGSKFALPYRAFR